MGAVDLSPAAVAYAVRLGLRVLPTGPDCKTPIVARGVHAATADPNEIRRIWRERPGANIAVACGPRSDLWTLDIDNKAQDGFLSLAALEDEHGPLPQSWRSRTPSGGQHRYFSYPHGRELRNRQRLYLDRPDGSRDYFPGLDVRAGGGTAALPPSRRGEGAYRWIDHPLAVALAPAPEWLLRLIDPPQPERAAPEPLRCNSLERTARYVASAINSECGDLAAMGPGTGRNNALFGSSARLHELAGANLAPLEMIEDALVRAAEACGLVKDDGRHAVLATIRSGREHGLRNPRKVAP